MLILSRKKEESIRLTLGDTTVFVTVCEIERGKVRLAFDAPREVEIERTEIDRRNVRSQPAE